ncbi:17173_t:CDS:2 [Funneliformis caledonium]|uniref:17173_t:CDS:1 n=1 Tax=Funneliformis caledonium TaxID=1117310 RepID=A0A9N9I840_9GLOM|nr:17173_t:CDS:2 [Funneliformis caledonium]
MASISRDNARTHLAKLTINFKSFATALTSFLRNLISVYANYARNKSNPPPVGSQIPSGKNSTTWERAEIDEYVTFGNASISEDVGVQWLKLKITTVRLWPPSNSNYRYS